MYPKNLMDYLMDSTVDVRVIIQEVDNEGEVRYDNIYLLSKDTPQDVMREINSQYASLQDLIDNEDHKEEYQKRLKKPVKV